jgi:hypothetical protein
MTVTDSHVPDGHSPPRVETTTNGSSAAADEDGELGADGTDDGWKDADADVDGAAGGLPTGLGDGDPGLLPQPLTTSTTNCRATRSAMRRPMAR